MVFKNDLYNNTDQITYISVYHKYWLSDGKRNPAFDMFSGKILDLKQSKPEAINYFYHFLDSELNNDVTICVVPPSSAGTGRNSGIGKVATLLAKNGRRDGIDYLERMRPVQKLATGGDRNRNVHYSSIRCNVPNGINGDVILLVDDVTTTGNSLYACKDILLKNGASSVKMVALGRTAME